MGLERRQCGLDGGDEDGVVGQGVGCETAYDLAAPVDEELLEVPGELRGVVHCEAIAAQLGFEGWISDPGDGLCAGEGFVEGTLIRASDDYLSEHGEGDVEGGVAELLDLLVGSGFLAAEIVGGKAEDVETTMFIGAVELFKAFVLGRKTTLGGGVDDEQDVALEGFQGGGLAGDGLEWNVVEA